VDELQAARILPDLWRLRSRSRQPAVRSDQAFVDAS